MEFEEKAEEVLQRLAHKVHANAVNKGFWECETCGGSGDIVNFKPLCPELHHEVIQPFGIDCPSCYGDGKYRHPAEAMALIHAEVSEAVEAMRDPDSIERCTKCNGANSYCKKCNGTGKALGGSRVTEELADVIIRVLDLCAAHGLDIGPAVIQKMAYNATRPHKHGKAF